MAAPSKLPIRNPAVATVTVEKTCVARFSAELARQIRHRRDDVGRHAERGWQELPGKQEQGAEGEASEQDRRWR
jgi:hypothetical protein